MTARCLTSAAGAIFLLSFTQPAPAQFALPLPDPELAIRALPQSDAEAPGADEPTREVVESPGVDEADETAPAVSVHGEEDSADHELVGLASWYGGKFNGRLTANGEIFDTNQLTAAHKTLPFGTIVRVTNANNDKFVIVRINDRGPFVEQRIIDLSRAAADIIGVASEGVAPVRLEIMHMQEESDLRTIQVASFSVRSNADDLVTELGNHGLTAVIETVADRGLHRVVLQGITGDELPEYRDRLAAVGFSNVLVRTK